MYYSADRGSLDLGVMYNSAERGSLDLGTTRDTVYREFDLYLVSVRQSKMISRLIIS